ncbi:MAG: efflux RND transporter periplasmic adaptor subunit [Dehalococcoidia bacterium]|nr:efflux RND transporter periplasmic adaptor subunit [Dehalococcoidia bacterium]
MIHGKRVTLLLLCTLLALPVIGCSSSEEDIATEGGQEYTVARGSLTVDVSASGNLAFSTEEDLAFDMAGTVQDIFVEDGDAVTAGMVVATLDTSDWEERLRSLQMSLLSAEISLKQAKIALEAAEEDTQTSITGDVVTWCCPDDDEIEIKELQLEQAELKLDDAQAQLDEHLAQSPEVVAPFDGFVTKVVAEGGDEVLKGSVAVTVVDPGKFEALIYVSENDIEQVVEGTQAEVSIDSMSGTVLPAEVTAIAPTATISSGVVNYEVTVTVSSLEEIQAQMEEAMSRMEQEREEATSSGEMPERLKTAIEAGEMTEEEALALMERMQSGGPTQNAATTATAMENIQLREGLSVSVTLLIAEKTNIILVPNAAISTAGSRSFVTVLAEDGSEEQRTITTGISNWQFTEVTDGLAEGEVIKTIGTVPTLTDGERPNGMFVMGGGGHPRT